MHSWQWHRNGYWVYYMCHLFPAAVGSVMRGLISGGWDHWSKTFPARSSAQSAAAADRSCTPPRSAASAPGPFPSTFAPASLQRTSRGTNQTFDPRQPRVERNVSLRHQGGIKTKQTQKRDGWICSPTKYFIISGVWWGVGAMRSSSSPLATVG